MLSNHYSNDPLLLSQPQMNGCDRAASLDTQTQRQWPWRIFPFASDLGTVGCLLKRPKLGLLGWAIAAPYYLVSILKQPNGQQRKNEALYQATANGVFPFLAAKTGAKFGEALYRLLKAHSLNAVNVLWKQNRLKLLGGLLGLVVLTPTVGDPISRQLCQKYQNRHLNLTI